MLDKLNAGFSLILNSFKIFSKYPKLIIPLFITWLVYAPTILYLRYGFHYQNFSSGTDLLIIFLVILVFAFLLAFSSTIQLEMIQQIEHGATPSLLQSFSKRFGIDMIKILPIVFIWAVVWFILLIIGALLSRRSRSGNGGLSAENAAKTLAGYDGASILTVSISAINDGIRMLVFLILPAIVWEGLSFNNAVKKGFYILKVHLVEFTSGYLLTEAVATVLFLPPVLLFYLLPHLYITVPNIIWYLVILYLAFAWSYTMYLEQMFTSQLYLWDMLWEKEVAYATKSGTQIPTLEQIPAPDLLDDTPELSPDTKVVYDSPIIANSETDLQKLESE